MPVPAALLPDAGFGPTRRRLLETLKRRGTVTLHEVSAELGLSRETLREHVQALAAEGLVARAGTRRHGPGRPEVLYGVTPRADALFPQRESQVLADLAAQLLARGHGEELKRFFAQRAARRLRAGRARLSGLRGRRRLEEVARILSEEGYMAEVVDGTLRLAHCPLMGVVAVTRLPCRAELGMVEALLGRRLRRIDYLPEGGSSCSYRTRRAPARR
ncbi:MAG TPA: helix-turn-helix domain-containing protein [Gemmatimonadales bacterium]|nr:helix-turn-helix domain-containing protein [Gemmatimonadales bacterium]